MLNNLVLLILFLFLNFTLVPADSTPPIEPLWRESDARYLGLPPSVFRTAPNVQCKEPAYIATSPIFVSALLKDYDNQPVKNRKITWFFITFFFRQFIYFFFPGSGIWCFDQTIFVW